MTVSTSPWVTTMPSRAADCSSSALRTRRSTFDAVAAPSSKGSCWLVSASWLLQLGDHGVELGVETVVRADRQRVAGQAVAARRQEDDEDGGTGRSGQGAASGGGAHGVPLVWLGWGRTASRSSPSHCSSAVSRTGWPPTRAVIGRGTRIVRVAGFTRLPG